MSVRKVALYVDMISFVPTTIVSYTRPEYCLTKDCQICENYLYQLYWNYFYFFSLKFLPLNSGLATQITDFFRLNRATFEKKIHIL